MTNHTLLVRYRRVRIFVRTVFAFGILVSLTANVLGANPHPISQSVAAWAPLALLLAVELIVRIPVARRGRSLTRLSATTIIAGIAAWVSYWHMVAVAARYGETGPTPYLLPISVDGLIVAAAVTLVEIGDRIRHLEHHQHAPTGPVEPVHPAPPAIPPAPTIPPDVTRRLAAAHGNGHRPPASPATGTTPPQIGELAPAGTGTQEPLL